MDDGVISLLEQNMDTQVYQRLLTYASEPTENEEIAESDLPSGTWCQQNHEEGEENTEKHGEWKPIEHEYQGLRKVSIAHCEQLTDLVLYQLAESAPHLRYFSCKGCPFITDIGLQSLLWTCYGLYSLSVSRCVFLSDTFACDLADSASANTLAHLDVSYCSEITDDGFRRILEQCGSLTSFDASYCGKFSDAAMLQLSQQEVLLPRLRELHLTRNQIHQLPSRVCTLARALVKLYLSCNPLDEIPEEIGHLESLQYLYLHKTNVRHQLLPLCRGTFLSPDVDPTVDKRPALFHRHVAESARTERRRESIGGYTRVARVLFSLASAQPQGQPNPNPSRHVFSIT